MLDPVSRRTQSWRDAVVPLVFHFGVHLTVSRYSPPIPEGLLGAQKTALAEWKTEMLSMSSIVGQAEMGGVPVKVEFCW